MAHVFVLLEAREVWMQTFLNDLLERRYPYQMTNGNVGLIQPNPREIKLFDISLPKECIPLLMGDLAPFAHKAPRTDSPLKDKAGMVAGVIREAGGLKPFNDLTKAVSELEEDEIKDMTVKEAPIVGKYYKKLSNCWFAKLPFIKKKVRVLGYALVKDLPFVGEYLNKLVRAKMRDDLSMFKATEEVRHSWVNVMPIGWKEDPTDPTAPKGKFWNLPHTDKGGELL